MFWMKLMSEGYGAQLKSRCPWEAKNPGEYLRTTKDTSPTTQTVDKVPEN